jgi:hypothetical protein
MSRSRGAHTDEQELRIVNRFNTQMPSRILTIATLV